MASQIELLIFDGRQVPAALPSRAKVVPLSGPLRVVPVTEDLLGHLAAGGRDDAVYPGWVLKAGVCRLALEMSRDRRVLYIYGETFGPGTQEAAGWARGELVHGPSGTCDLESDLECGYRMADRSDSAINAGLRMMGVQASPDLDEYGTVGLTRHRFTDGWLAG